jgi:hypothetical protein
MSKLMQELVNYVHVQSRVVASLSNPPLIAPKALDGGEEHKEGRQGKSGCFCPLRPTPAATASSTASAI